MAITKEDLLNELKELHQLQNDITRRMLALTLKVQNMLDAKPLRGEHTAQELLAAHASAQVHGAKEGSASLAAIEASMSAQGMQLPKLGLAPQTVGLATPHRHDGVLDRDGKTTQPSPSIPREIFIPQMNTQETIDAARRALDPKTAAQTALASAQSLLKQAMRNAGHTESAIALVDQVGLEHLSPNQTVAGSDFIVPAADRLVEQPVEAASQPTEVQVEEEVAQGILSAFIGRGSVFMEHLHTSMMFGAHGELQAGYEMADGKAMKRYENDAFWIDELSLRKWPTGFYLDRDTKQLQFLVKTDQFALLLTALPSEVSPVKVRFYGMADGWKDIGDFMLGEQKLIHAKVSDALVGLKKK